MTTLCECDLRQQNTKPKMPIRERAPGPQVVSYAGERIYFRPIELEDETILRRWINDPSVWRTLCIRPPVNAVRQQEWIETLSKDPTQTVFGIVAREDRRLIGTVGLTNIRAAERSADLGISVGEVAWWERGYGREAVRLMVRYGFEELNLNRIGLQVYSDNWRAIRCYQKAGFVHEGCLSQAAYRNGRYQDVYLFAMLRDQWESGQYA
ncbi:MAG: GNAT family N-acetyltransferase [Phycisphaerales bacterium]|nr:GNAT family N-acetyltransferase [Phycisphaerales bacterium]